MVALFTILVPVSVVIIFSLRVLGIYYAHSRKLFNLKQEKYFTQFHSLKIFAIRLVQVSV